jgi:hypothetical protein
MAITVLPPTFNFVHFDAEHIEALVGELLERLGMAERNVEVRVDETTPIVRISVEDGDPLIVRADSGAFEDPRRPREMSDENVRTNTGRVLLRARDRGDGSFAAAPADDQLTLLQLATWDTYCVGRLARLGYRVFEPRWRYNFRNRHGFSDASDAIFDELWTADALTWEKLSALADTAVSTPSPR